ncbi:hypothetical protein Hena1_01350 [Erwinia phage Hena1]|uniref:Uncharacterized protein n=1 Tax=Erwinia phage Hena1 TaxID=2678601 RepID=A0A6B9J5W6_9CAUD|nr:Rz-like spanin [Erwinia phage Hena1]QGZ16285.1 hypothetical protein Hena1_01350 [Erwinia phage Hena1]
MITFEAFLIMVRKYKKIIVAGVFALTLVIGALWVHSWYEDQLTAQYNSGVTVTDTKWEKQMQNNKIAQAAFKADQQALTDKLQEQLAEANSRIADLEKSSGAKQDEYAKSDAGKKTGLDDKAVDIYNESLGIGK